MATKWISILSITTVVISIFIFCCGRFDAPYGRAFQEIAFLGENESSWLNQLKPEDQVLALAFADPESDATTAFRRSDLRFIGVLAQRIIAPPWDAPIENVRIIAFTSDVQRSFESENLNWLAANYAKHYNMTLQKLMLDE